MALWLAMEALAHGQPASSPATVPEASAREKSLPEFNGTSPHTVFVAVSQAEVFSGPSKDFYPTSHLARGAALEVYHRTADGWLGIRPPERSFSWVPAADAYLLPGGRVIEITKEHAVSWIGTELGSAKQYRWQVEFHAGEQLAVLGEMTTKGTEGRETLWYKIAPPAGEFRWIQERAVSLSPPSPSAAANPAPSSGRVTSAAHRSTGEDNAVQAADFTEDIFSEESILYDDSPMQLGDGEVYEFGETYASAAPRAANRWDGWHALELTDDGFHIPFLERRYQQAQARMHHDPRNDDPFNLSMPGKVVQPQSIRETVREDMGIPPTSRYTPWRDPRDLRSKRLKGNPSSSFSEPQSREASRESFADRRAASVDEDGSSGGLLGRLVSSASRGVEAANLLARDAAAVTNDSSADATAVNGGPSDAGGVSRDIDAADGPGAPAANQATWYGVGQVAASTGVRELDGAALGQLQLILSEMVSQPMNQWTLQPLLDRSKYFIEHGQTPLERGQARLLLERIEAFELLARKSGFGAADPVLTASGIAPSTGSLASGANGTPVTTASYQPALAPDANGPGGYDATGWLVPVHASSAGQPTHAITTDAGRIIAYVSGLPGLNLDIYVNQAVGIIGLRGYLPQLQAQHIQAQRVVRLR